MNNPISPAQRYQLVLADIAMAAAIATCGGAPEPSDLEDYAPGAMSDRWLRRNKDEPSCRQVTAMANAGVGALQQLAPERLQQMAARYGVPLDAELAATMSEHFAAKRAAWLQYNK